MKKSEHLLNELLADTSISTNNTINQDSKIDEDSEFENTASLDYNLEYHKNYQEIVQLKLELERYREALLNLALKM